ncbi:hypothetical protein CRENBAI_011899 [Crenichthys baileyi]|uniref:Uncharacterized protein n=1 Tax=Crenichthys baileyi TaxID=28760 RepID=A0AAV9SDP1_9TELE
MSQKLQPNKEGVVGGVEAACHRAPPEEEQDDAVKAACSRAPPGQEQEMNAVRLRTPHRQEQDMRVVRPRTPTKQEQDQDQDQVAEVIESRRLELRRRANCQGINELKGHACDTVCSVGKRLMERRSAADCLLEVSCTREMDWGLTCSNVEPWSHLI